MTKQNKVTLTYGTFDLFHYGHERLLLRIKSKTDYLIVGVSTDKYNYSKNKNAIQNQYERFDFLNSLHYIDKVIWEDNVLPQWINDYREYNADEIVMGSDHINELDYLRKIGINISYLKRTSGISTSYTKNKMDLLKPIIFFDDNLSNHNQLSEKIIKCNHNNFIIIAIPESTKVPRKDIFNFWSKKQFVDLCLYVGDADDDNTIIKKYLKNK
ncbi:MAG: adenylyltransferase/cytidyltransferase family protein [Mycoplasmataceae bacterium]|nr:adenylyltransferase/cytidyltransferase family protein [Mycoplasmataceae bacterium]